MTLACEDANSKLVDAVIIADDGCVGNNLLQIRKLRFVQKAKLLFRLGDKEFKNSRAGRLVSILNRLYIKPKTTI